MTDIFQAFDAFRGRHDFTVDPVLMLPGGVEVFCIEGTLDGHWTMFIQGRCTQAGTLAVLDYFPKQEEGA